MSWRESATGSGTKTGGIDEEVMKVAGTGLTHFSSLIPRFVSLLGSPVHSDLTGELCVACRCEGGEIVCAERPGLGDVGSWGQKRAAVEFSTTPPRGLPLSSKQSAMPGLEMGLESYGEVVW